MSLHFLNLILAESEKSDPFEDLKKIGEKIIPNDIWAILVQLVATFLLVLILAKFLVKPVRKFIAKRNEIIQNDLDSAALKNNEATLKLQEANETLRQAKKSSKELVENAKVTALNEKDRITAETNLEVENLRSKAKSDIENERLKMQEEIHDEIVSVALKAATKVVEREIDEKDNEKIIREFVEDNK